MDSISDKFKIS